MIYHESWCVCYYSDNSLNTTYLYSRYVEFYEYLHIKIFHKWFTSRGNDNYLYKSLNMYVCLNMFKYV